jgi:hypothetical protein
MYVPPWPGQGGVERNGDISPTVLYWSGEILVRMLFGKMFVEVLFHLDENFMAAAIRP